MKASALLGLASSLAVCSDALDVDGNSAANPIRKVVNLLQAMQAKVAAEGKKEEELYKKFMCYCKKGGDDLTLSISDAQNKIPQLGSDIKSAQEKKVQTEQELEQAQSDRAAAKTAIQEAEAMREKEAAAFAKEKAELDSNIAAIDKAVAALERGMAGGFLQTTAAQVLRKIVISGKDMSDGDRQALMSFLGGSEDADYAPRSGEVTGILKEMSDDMKKSLKDATDEENSSVENFKDLMKAKKKEVEALTVAIETKSRQIGDLGVSIAQMQNDLTDSEEALIADQKFQAELKKSCSTKTDEWEARKTLRNEELVAIAETIKVLNDDDALDIFKKTLPGASASFVQFHDPVAGAKEKALALINTALEKQDNPDRLHLDLVALALRGKKVGLEKVVRMVDNMIKTLKSEQVEDDNKQDYCNKQLDQAEDKKKALAQKVDDHETSLASAKESIGTLKDELKALDAGLKKLERSVADATEQRQAQHAEYKELLADNHAAKELLNWAINRLNKFYNPKLYKPPPKQAQLFEETGVVDTPGSLVGVSALAQVSAHMHHKNHKDDPGPPPETFSGDYKKKGEETNGVVAMIKLLIKDLDKEITEAEVEEKNSQKDYADGMNDAAEKRAADSKSIAEKHKALADMEVALETHTEGKANAGREMMATATYITQLHGECDWLLQYYSVRKDARASEIDALTNAKAVLHGADFSMAQVKPKANFLKRA